VLAPPFTLHQSKGAWRADKFPEESLPSNGGVFFTGDPAVRMNGDVVVSFADLAIMKKAFFKKPGPSAGKP